MRKKCNRLALWSFVIALAIYAVTYFLFHYLAADGSFDAMYHTTPAKPFITLLFGMWGVAHQFAAATAWLIGRIFFQKESRVEV